jgi:RNA polymerase sigma-70 factor (ECF subfamily)
LAVYSSLSPDELVKACAGSNDPEAWEEFIQRFHGVIATAVLRAARRFGQPSRQLLDDLIQDTYLKLCHDNGRMLRSFQPHHPNAIFGFLRVVAANVVLDHFKVASAEKRGASQTDPYSENSGAVARNTTTAGLDPVQRRILMRQIDEILRQHLPEEEVERNRLIFWLYYRDGLSASAIAALPSIGLSTKGVESSLLRMTKMIKGHVIDP